MTIPPSQDENPKHKANFPCDEGPQSQELLQSHLTAHQPKANPDFQQDLEDRLIALLNAQHHPHLKEPIMTTLAQPKTTQRNLNFFWPTSLVATFSVVLLGLFITLFNQSPAPFGNSSNLAAPLMTATAQNNAEPSPVPLMTATPYVYTVQAGDTLLSIASLQNVDPEALLAINNLTADSPLTVGQTLMIPHVTAFFDQPETAIQLEVGLLTLNDLPRGSQIDEDAVITVYLSAEHVQRLILASGQGTMFNPNAQSIVGLYASQDIPARSLILTDQLSDVEVLSLEDAYSLILPANQLEDLQPNQNVRLESTIFFIDVDDTTQAVTGPTGNETPMPQETRTTLTESATILEISPEQDGLVTVYLAVSEKDVNTLNWAIDNKLSITLHALDTE